METNLKVGFGSLIVWTIFICAISTSCKNDDFSKVANVLTIDYGGQVDAIESLGYYSLSDATLCLQQNLPGNPETTCGFNFYRVTYSTTNYDNNKIWVSGLLAVPDSKEIKGIVSYQHGTNTDRNYAPSKPTTDEGMPLASLFAGNGYILLAADYIGLGVSQEIPTYVHVSSTTNAVVDFIKIGSKIINELTAGKNSNLFLVGFSQGAAATAGVHRELEKNNPTGLTLKASACIAGPYNIKDISVKYGIACKSTLYLGYVAHSYSHIYGGDLSSIIKAEYVNLVSTWFDGSKSWQYVINASPAEPGDLYTQDMIDDINNGNNNWFTAAAEQNETYRWKPVAKIRLIYGTTDTDVSPQDAISAYAYMNSIGGNVELVNAGEYDHMQCCYYSLPEIQKWFNNTK
jgi:hypothetical protein